MYDASLIHFPLVPKGEDKHPPTLTSGDHIDENMTDDDDGAIIPRDYLGGRT